MKLKQYKTARRLGARIFSKTQNPKFALTKKTVARKRPAPLSEYGLQLIEKQKMRYVYNLSEHQFANYVKKAMQKRGVNPGDYLYKNLELRLDNVVYRLGLAKTRPLARQMVSHGHITVNGRRVTVPSFAVSLGNRVGVRAGSKDKKLFSNITELEMTHNLPSWLEVDTAKIEGHIKGEPKTSKSSEDVFNVSSVIGFYSR